MSEDMRVERLSRDDLKRFFGAALSVRTGDIPTPEILWLEEVVKAIFSFLFVKKVTTRALSLLATEDWRRIHVRALGFRGYKRAKGTVHVRVPLDQIRFISLKLAREDVKNPTFGMVVQWTTEEIGYSRNGLLSPARSSLMNRLRRGTNEDHCQRTESIIEVLGIDRVQCLIRLYRLITYLELIRKSIPPIDGEVLFHDGDKRERSFTSSIRVDRIVEEVRQLGGTSKENANKTAEALYLNTVLEKERTRLLRQDRLVSRKLVRNTPPKLVGKHDYAKQVLLFSLIAHIKSELNGKRKKGFRMYEALTDFFIEQDIQISMDARDLRRVYARIEKMTLPGIYESYREFYVAYLIHKEPPTLDDLLLAAEVLRTIAADPSSASTNPAFLELFPSWGDIMPKPLS